ncbi:MAG: FtsQ-type POTRA domain-containing protein [Microbacteriaceae bacterium]
MKPPKHHGALPPKSSPIRTPRIPLLKTGGSLPRADRADRTDERRFTAGARRQRVIRLTATLSVLGFFGMVAIIVLSPLMKLTTIEVVGRQNIDEKVITGAVLEQVGTPLALIDYDAIAERLGTVVQIKSFSTELRPPHTLVVRIVERVPIGAMKADKGWNIVDAAGVVMQNVAKEPQSVPQLVVNGVDSAGFGAAVKALLALPAELRADVAAISAESRDSVAFVLRGVSHEIRWGSEENAALKAVVLDRALAIAKDKGGRYVIDVSAPDSLIMNRLN